MSSLNFISENSRKAVVAMLTGDITSLENMLNANKCSPIQLFRWTGDRRGVSNEGVIDSFHFSYAMFDALKNDKLFNKLNIAEMWELHQKLMPNIERTCYDQFGFIVWNWMEEPGDNPYFDEEEEQELVNSGIKLEDVRLTNAGIQHMEKELISLLKAGASPYFLIMVPDIMETYINATGELQHTYFDVAPMLDIIKLHSADSWYDYIGDSFKKDIHSLDTSSLEWLVEGIFNVAACERILHLTDKYICDDARLEGEKLMLEYLGKIHSITE